MRPILVVGSLNMDLVVQTSKAPAAGETLAARSFHNIPGGKGANQAVAVARLINSTRSDGSQVRMVGRVGEDAFGEQLIKCLATEGIDTSEVRYVPDVSTGVAIIIVEQSGENRILIVAGANGVLKPQDIDAISGWIQQAGLVVLQFEIPMETVERAIQLANAHNVPVLLNPAPAYPAPAELLARVDTLVVNEVECSMLSGFPVSNPASAAIAGHRLLAGRTRLVVVTLGSIGAVAITPGTAIHVPAFPVKAVDTTAAGDSFIGALAVSLIQSKDLVQSITFASAAGALAVTRIGAQSSIPHIGEVEEFLEKEQITVKFLNIAGLQNP